MAWATVQYHQGQALRAHERAVVLVDVATSGRWIVPILGLVIGVVGLRLFYNAPSAPIPAAPIRTAARTPLIAKAKEAPTAPVAAGASAKQQAQVEDIARGMIEAAAEASGKREGLAAFPPPGTNPIKLGIVVPDDYQLPEGYVRYYQLTDDGRRLEPILMFSPDYEFVDAGGNPVELPPDGVVPSDMAPPGMPIRMLEMPDHPYGGLGSR